MRLHGAGSRCSSRVAIALWLAVVAGAPALSAQSPPTRAPVTDAVLQSPAAEDWLMWRRTLDGWGYSPLDQITRDNVGELRLAWSTTCR